MNRRRTRSPDDDRDDNQHSIVENQVAIGIYFRGLSFIIYIWITLFLLINCYPINRGLDDNHNTILIVVEH